MAKGFKWEKRPEDAFAELYDDYAKRIYRAIAELAKSYVPQIEAWMVANKVWVDRTGNLKQSLFADVELALTEIVLFFDYGLDYGVYLEFRNQAQYGIIAPALDYFAPKFWADVQALFK